MVIHFPILSTIPEILIQKLINSFSFKMNYKTFKTFNKIGKILNLIFIKMEKTFANLADLPS